MKSRKQSKVCVVLNRKELRILREGMLYFRNKVIANGGPTEDIDGILLRIFR